MPILPLGDPEPFAATFGVMLYPGLDEAEQARARAFTSHWLAEPIRRSTAAGHPPTLETLQYVATNCGQELTDLERRFDGGILTGELFKVLFILARSEPTLASWENAIKIAVRSSPAVPRSRASVFKTRNRFHSVAHLWAAWTIRDGKFVTRPEIGYDGYEDFHAFLAEAEILRDFGQTWRHGRAKSTPPLPSEVWRVPDDWKPRPRRDDWPITGVIAHMSLPPELIEGLKPSGRPRSSG